MRSCGGRLISGPWRSKPCATWIWQRTRSMPVTISVTVCSTWMRGLTSMKYHSPESMSTRNSTVPAFTYPAARVSFTAASASARRMESDSPTAGATSESGFDDQREADPARDLRRFGRVRDRFLRARHHRDAGPDGQLARGCFVAQQFQQFGPGTDESYSCFGTGAGQRRILRKKA